MHPTSPHALASGYGRPAAHPNPASMHTGGSNKAQSGSRPDPWDQHSSTSYNPSMNRLDQASSSQFDSRSGFAPSHHLQSLPPGLAHRHRSQTLLTTSSSSNYPSFWAGDFRPTTSNDSRSPAYSQYQQWSTPHALTNRLSSTAPSEAYYDEGENTEWYTHNTPAGTNRSPIRSSTTDSPGSASQMGAFYGHTAHPQPGPQTTWPKSYQQRRPSNRDEFDGPSQLLPKNDLTTLEPREDDLPMLPTSLYAQEQDEIALQVSRRLSQCAFDFVSRYQFPIPLEQDKRPVRVATDREWAEWVHLLKRLATKRRIPTRVLYHGQIRQLTTILESSLDMRPAARHQSRPLKDDRNVLQLISAGLQVAKILKDASAMQHLDAIYTHTEMLIHSRRAQSAAFSPYERS